MGVITVGTSGLAKARISLFIHDSGQIEVAELRLEEIVLESVQHEHQFSVIPDQH